VRGIDLESTAEPGSRPEAHAGGELSLDTVYRTHAELVSRWIRRLEPNDDPEDLLHEVFLVVRRRLPTFRGDAAITTWLFAITVRVVGGRRRKQKLRRLLFGRFEGDRTDQPSPATPEMHAARTEASRVLYELLERLGERDRTLLILFELEGLSGKEIAAVMGVPERGLWTLLHRARGRLKRAYIERYGIPEGGAP